MRFWHHSAASAAVRHPTNPIDCATHAVFPYRNQVVSDPIPQNGSIIFRIRRLVMAVSKKMRVNWERGRGVRLFEAAGAFALQI